jgi:hypothetical protein
MAGSGNIRYELGFGVRSPLNDILTEYTSGSVCIIIFSPLIFLCFSLSRSSVLATWQIRAFLVAARNFLAAATIVLTL